MEQKQEFKLDENLRKDINQCKKNIEFIEKILTMIVKGFASEY